jgi:hypothetical protein
VKHLLIALSLASLVAAPNAELSQVQSVYVMPMAGGLHQHLTNRLVKLGLFQIVADPLRADAIFTDRLGNAFETQLSDWDFELARRNAPPQEAKPAEGEGGNQPLELASRPMTTAITRGRGTLFLVDRASRRVLWSAYQKPKNTQPDELDRTAGRVANRIKDDWAAKKK